MADRLALFTGGQFAISHAKTAHGILRYGERDVVCVVDSESAGSTAEQVVPYARRVRADRGHRRRGGGAGRRTCS